MMTINSAPMTRMLRRVLFALGSLVALSIPVEAQTKPTIPVLGVGVLAFDLVGAESIDEVQARVIKVYVDQRPAQVVATTCTGAGAPFTCRVPLAALNLTTRHTVAVTQTIVAADGEVESDRAEAPFDLRKVSTPAPLQTSSIRVQPGP